MLFQIEGVLKCAFLVISLLTVPSFKFKAFQLAIGLAVCLLGLKRQLPGIGFSKQNLQTIFVKEFG